MRAALTSAFLLTLAAPCAWSQRMVANAAAHGPVNVPGWPSVAGQAQDIAMPADGGCQAVHPGDTVHFDLKIESAEGARAIFTELQMDGAGHRAKFRPADLPLARGNVLAAGASSTRDAADPTVYHFSFLVPQVDPGVYRMGGFAVRTAYGGMRGEGGMVPLNRHAREQVRRYCLAVFGGMHSPVVTEFLPRQVEQTSQTVGTSLLP